MMFFLLFSFQQHRKKRMMMRFLVFITTASFLGPVDANKMLNIVSNSIVSSFGGSSNTTVSTTHQTKLEVIGAGLGRTGTSSLHAALNILGYKTYQMSDNAMHGHSDLWSEALLSQERSDYHSYSDNYYHDDAGVSRSDDLSAGEEKEQGQKREENRRRTAIRAVAEALERSGFDATTDDPAADLAMELLQEYPEAKVILTTRRDPEKWYSSIRQLGLTVSIFKMSPLYFLPSQKRLMRLAHIIQGHPRRKCIGEFGWLFFPKNGLVPDKNTCLDYYHNHNSMIQNSVPPSQLLEYQLGDGWEPLCAFLGKPVPDVPFPHLNDASSVRIAIMILLIVTLAYYGMVAYLVVVLPVRWYFCHGTQQQQNLKQD